MHLVVRRAYYFSMPMLDIFKFFSLDEVYQVVRKRHCLLGIHSINFESFQKNCREEHMMLETYRHMPTFKMKLSLKNDNS